MSADAWRICPNCKRILESAAEEKIKKAKESYGKVSEKEYLKLKEEANESSEVTEETLREDYEVYMNEDGVFTIRYKCSCDCGFSYEFRRDIEVFK